MVVELTGSGQFSLKTAIDLVRPKYEQKTWYNIIWSKKNHKLTMCAYKALMNRLSTMDRLSKWGINNNGKCVLYDNETETHNHFYFLCPLSSYIWNICKGNSLLNFTGSKQLEEEVVLDRSLQDEDSHYGNHQSSVHCLNLAYWARKKLIRPLIRPGLTVLAGNRSATETDAAILPHVITT